VTPPGIPLRRTLIRGEKNYPSTIGEEEERLNKKGRTLSSKSSRTSGEIEHQKRSSIY